VKPGQQSMGETPGLSHCSLSILTKTDWWHCSKGKKPTVSSLFFGAIFYDRVSKTTKDVSVQFFILCINLYKLYQRIPVDKIRKFQLLFEATS